MGFFDKLKKGLTRTREAFTDKINTIVLGRADIDDDLLDEIEETLIMADVGVDTTEKLMDAVRQGIKHKDIHEPADLIPFLENKIGEILQSDDAGLHMAEEGPTVFLAIGVNGAGKTTTIGKLSAYYKAQGKSVMLAAADTFRAAAIDQLEVWGERTGAAVIRHEEGSDPAAVAFDAVKAAKARGIDILIIDTAGIRKKAKVDYGVEKFAVDRAIRSIRECDVALMVIDATEAINGISDQDKKIASIITEAGKGMVIAINKWDLIEDKKSNTINKFEEKIAREIPFLDYVPKIYISAVTHQRLNQIFTRVVEVQKERSKRVSTGLLNKVINEAYALNPPQTIRNKRLKIMYSTQAAIEPPTFILFANNEDLMKDHYKRYMENKLREAFGFMGTPIRLSIRTRSEKKK